MNGENERTSMTISLPATQKEYVETRAVASGCGTPSEYLQRLIRADQEAHEQQELERKILEGLDSPSREITSKDWQSLRTTLRQKLTKRRKAQ